MHRHRLGFRNGELISAVMFPNSTSETVSARRRWHALKGLLIIPLVITIMGSRVEAQAIETSEEIPVQRRGLADDSPYRLSLVLDVPITFASVGLIVGGFAWEQQIESLDEAQVLALDPADVNAFDRPATGLWSEPAQTVSDVGAVVAALLPLSLYASPAARRDGWRVTAMWAEVFLLTQGLTEFAKAGAARSRPYLYNDVLTLEERTTGRLASDGRRSFFSGHTSLSAAFVFYTAMIVQTYHPASPWSRLAWIGGASLAALNASMRVIGGKHFPTDVIVGYAVGALVGVGIPLLHRIELRDRTVAFSPFFDRASAGLMARGSY